MVEGFRTIRQAGTLSNWVRLFLSLVPAGSVGIELTSSDWFWIRGAHILCTPSILTLETGDRCGDLQRFGGSHKQWWRVSEQSDKREHCLTGLDFF
ncbi:hypothetical protein U1Q18_003778 [Sarracenia purpurea var. burkii]